MPGDRGGQGTATRGPRAFGQWADAREGSHREANDEGEGRPEVSGRVDRRTGHRVKECLLTGTFSKNVKPSYEPVTGL